MPTSSASCGRDFGPPTARLFVIAANEGVDEPTRALWHECDDVGMPRAVVITKLDHARANYAGALRAAQDAFGEKVLPLYLPADDGLVGLLSHDQSGPQNSTNIAAASSRESSRSPKTSR